MKKTVYLDSTIPSYLFDKRKDIINYINTTKQWWNKERDNYDLYISEETIRELNAGNYPNKKEIIYYLAKIDLLPSTDEIISIVKIYIKNHLMPKVFQGDAIHLAYASFYKIDFLLTWNCNHLANANKRQHIKIINKQLDLWTPEIITPLELFREEDSL